MPILLWRFSVPTDKYFFETNQQSTLYYLDKEWLAYPNIYWVTTLAFKWFYSLIFSKKLTNLIPSCPGAAIAVNFFQEISFTKSKFLASRAKALATACFWGCPPITTHPVAGQLHPTWKQEFASSTLVIHFALQLPEVLRSSLPN